MNQNLSTEDVNTIHDMADHLDYCGYGDNWEREGAIAQKLLERVEKLLNKLQKMT